MNLFKRLSFFKHLIPSKNAKVSDLVDGIYCVNYHRIGNPAFTKSDPNVFSCSEEAFEQQIAFYKQHFSIITIKEVNKIIDSGIAPDKRYLLITFDDGYVDNYYKAYPILVRHEVSACFFITTQFADGQKKAWWDEVAEYINYSRDMSLTIPQLKFKVSLKNKQAAIQKTLRLFKSQQEIPMATKVNWLKECLVSSAQRSSSRVSNFMDWTMIRELHTNGMDIGSHTCSHEMLSHLNENKVRVELSESKRIIEERIGAEILALAYPVGASSSYELNSGLIAANCGYTLAFDFEKGINSNHLRKKKFELHRFPINVDHQLNDIINMMALSA